MTNNLRNRAMLADLTIRKAPTKKSDKEASKATAQAHGASAEMWTTTKSLLPPDAPKLVKLNKIAGQMSTRHRELTLPWLDSGPRILSASPAHYFQYRQEMDQFAADYLAAADDLADDYLNLQAQAARLQGTAYNPDEYLSKEEFRRRFAAGVNILPMPDVDDMRYAIGDAELERIKQDTQSTLNAALDLAMADVWKRIQTVVAAMVDGLKDYDEKIKNNIPGQKGSFRDTLVENVRDLVAILPSLNITDNQDLKDFTTLMQGTLCRYDAEQLRVNSGTRENVTAAAASILEQMSEFI